MKKMKTLSMQIGDIIYFKVPKKDGGATIRGNTVWTNKKIIVKIE